MSHRNSASGSFVSVVRHEEFYINGGDLYFLIDNVQFRVHRYFFERESSYFRGKLTTPASPGASRLGVNESSAIILEGVRPVEFAKFLWKYSLYKAPIEDWMTILSLSHRWTFPEVKSLAVREMEKLPCPDIDRIVAYHSSDVDRNLLIPRYAALCERMETTLMIARAREYARANVTANGLRSPTVSNVRGTELNKIVRELFGIPVPVIASPDDDPISPVPSPVDNGHTAEPLINGNATSSSGEPRLNGTRTGSGATPLVLQKPTAAEKKLQGKKGRNQQLQQQQQQQQRQKPPPPPPSPLKKEVEVPPPSLKTSLAPLRRIVPPALGHLLGLPLGEGEQGGEGEGEGEVGGDGKVVMALGDSGRGEGERKVEDVKAEEVKVEEVKAEEVKEEAKAEEVKVEEVKPEASVDPVSILVTNDKPTDNINDTQDIPPPLPSKDTSEATTTTTTIPTTTSDTSTTTIGSPTIPNPLSDPLTITIPETPLSESVPEEVPAPKPLLDINFDKPFSGDGSGDLAAFNEQNLWSPVPAVSSL
ncbi:hypothetical protein BDQ17DRAFT_1405297 [Cyathus striatus]|nr:hypothetical protein BDQ17DRAFT_1405297 [Cyathus striatus]